MKSTAKKRRNSLPRNAKRGDSSSSPTAISFTPPPQGLSLPFMKKVYCLLCHLSLNTRVSCSDSGAVTDKEFDLLGSKVSVSSLHDLSDVLFEELVKRFQQLGFGTGLCGSAEELKLLLRCCMVVLTLPIDDWNQERHRCLFSILNGIISTSFSMVETENNMSFRRLVTRRCTSRVPYTGSVNKILFASMSFSNVSHLHLPLLSQILEVFADEFLTHDSLRKNLTCHYGHGDIGIVLEALSAHLVLSVANEQEFDNFPCNLYWRYDKDVISPELSLTTALQLLLNPIMNTTPKILRTHFISLVAEAFGIHNTFENVKPAGELMDCYITAFKISIDMYRRHMTSLLTDSQPMTGSRSHPSFDSYILSTTGEKINGLQTRYEMSWCLYLHNKLLKSKSNLIAASTTYLKDFQKVYDKSLEEDILWKLTCIMHETSSDYVSCTKFNDAATRSPQDIFILSAILKLMGCTMSHIIGSLTCVERPSDASAFKEYNLIEDIIGCFQQLNLDLATQKLMFDKMETCSMRHKRLKWMLLHFLGLLPLSLVSGLEFLVKSCIFVIMTLMNLFVLLEGSSNVMKWLNGVHSENSSSGLSSNNNDEVRIIRKSSFIIASRFSKIRNSRLSSCSPSGPLSSYDYRDETSENLSSLIYHEESVVIKENHDENNGKSFLKCLIGQSGLPSDFDDLCDFIECKPWKDYSVWLKDRQRYRSWKYKKMSNLRQKKKMTTMRILRGNNI